MIDLREHMPTALTGHMMVTWPVCACDLALWTTRRILVAKAGHILEGAP